MKFEHRKEIFEHFYNTIPCTYSLTCEVDITSVVKSKKGVNVGILYAIAKVLNSLENFRMYYENEILDCYEVIHPSFTLLNQSKTGFLNLFFEYSQDFVEFKERYLEVIATYKDSPSLLPQKSIPQNVFMFSCIPWIKFSSFNLNLDKGSRYLLPIFTAGKFEKRENRFFMPLCLQVHHSVCDGYHLAMFFEKLEREISLF